MLAQALRPVRAVVLAPTFAEYELALRSVGCKVDHVKLEAAQGFTLANADSLCTVIDDTMDLVCLCNPNNPTGSLIEREMILEILEHCKACGTRVLLDECFNDFIEEPQRYTLKSDLKAYPNLFLLKAFTKRYSMAGIRLGYGMCWDEELLERMRSCVQPWNLVDTGPGSRNRGSAGRGVCRTGTGIGCGRTALDEGSVEETGIYGL